jgi:hypothetical protein
MIFNEDNFQMEGIQQPAPLLMRTHSGDAAQAIRVIADQ